MKDVVAIGFIDDFLREKMLIAKFNFSEDNNIRTVH